LMKLCELCRQSERHASRPRNNVAESRSQSVLPRRSTNSPQADFVSLNFGLKILRT
jgi:hypothetical protein